jgi:hypothetical protein
MHKSIEKAVKDIEAREKKLTALVLKIQSKCKHVEVVQKDWSAGFNPRRICVDCGLEEEGSHWSGDSIWSRKNFDKKPLLDTQRGRSIRSVGDEAFYRFRISHADLSLE